MSLALRLIGVGNSLVIQWLGCCALTTKGRGSIPAWETKISQAAWKTINQCVWVWSTFLVIKISHQLLLKWCMHSLISTRIISLGVLQDGDILILSFLLHFTSCNSSLKHFSSSITLLNQDRVLSGKSNNLSIVSLHLPLLKIIYCFPSMIQRKPMKFLWMY